MLTVTKRLVVSGCERPDLYEALLAGFGRFEADFRDLIPVRAQVKSLVCSEVRLRF